MPLNSHSDFHRAVLHANITLIALFSIAHLPDHRAKSLPTIHESEKPKHSGLLWLFNSLITKRKLHAKSVFESAGLSDIIFQIGCCFCTLGTAIYKPSSLLLVNRGQFIGYYPFDYSTRQLLMWFQSEC